MNLGSISFHCRGLTADAADPEVVEPDVVTDVVVVGPSGVCGRRKKPAIWKKCSVAALGQVAFHVSWMQGTYILGSPEWSTCATKCVPDGA